MRLQFNEVKNKLKEIFIKYGYDEKNAELLAYTHTETNKDGIFSHGTNRVKRFIDYIKLGYVDVSAKPKIEKENGSICIINGNLGSGVLNAYYAVDKAMEIADKYGIALVGLNNTTHWMRGGTYGLYAAKKGYVAISWTNTESCMPPWGGTEIKLGNNPFVMAAPGNPPALLDMAMSLYSYGKLQTTRLQNKELPFPGGYDKEGNLTSIPGLIEESKRILPMGYWKGSSFAFMLDILAAMLSNGLETSNIDKADKGICGRCSQVFIIIDPKKITESNRIIEIINNEIKHIKSSPLDNNSTEIRYPGEGVKNSNKLSEEKGIFVEDSIWKEILTL